MRPRPMPALGVVIVAIALRVGGCTRPATQDGGNWTCPGGWVRASVGGCGPATLLCSSSDAGTSMAATGACTGFDPAAPPPIALPDGGTLPGARRVALGEFEGAWPRADWMPDVPDETTPFATGVATCPANWTRTADGTCDAALRSDCPAGSLALPGGSCTQTVGTCGPGAFPSEADVPTGTSVRYVLAGADEMLSDGTRGRPYASIATAAAGAPDGAWLLVGVGTYREGVSIVRSLTVVGACTMDTVILGAASMPVVTVSGSGVHVTLRDITLTGGLGGLTVQSGAQVDVRRAMFRSMVSSAVHALGAGSTATLEQVAIDEVTAPDDRSGGYALRAATGGHIEASFLSARRARQYAVLAGIGMGTVTLRDSTLSETLPWPRTSYGEGVAAVETGHFIGERVAIRDMHEMGLISSGVGSHVDLTDVVITATVERPDATFGFAIAALNAGQIDALRLSIARNANGMLAGNPMSRITITDSTIAHTTPAAGSTLGRGVSVQTGASVLADNLRVIDTVNSAFFAASRGTQLQLRGVSVDGVRRAPGSTSNGVSASDGATVDAERVDIRGTSGAGVFASGSATMGQVDRIRVETAADPTAPDRPLGIVATAGARLTMQRVRVSGDSNAGVLVSDPNSALTIRDVLFDGRDWRLGSRGYGIVAQESGHLEVSRARVQAAHSVGIVCAYEGTTCVVDEALVRDTRTGGQSASGATAGAAGIASVDGAVLSARRVYVLETALTGVQCTSGARLEVSDSAIRGTTVVPGVVAAPSLSAIGASNISASRVWISDGDGVGVLAIGANAQVALADVSVTAMRPGAFGSGMGVFAAGGAGITATRLSVIDVSGIAVGASRAANDPTEGVTASRIDGQDWYVHGVRSGALAQPGTERGRPVSLGVFSGRDCLATVRRAVIDAGGWGLAVVQGRIEMTEGVVANQLDGVGASSEGDLAGQLILIGVVFRGNASNALRANVVLPDGAVLAPPTAVCLGNGC